VRVLDRLERRRGKLFSFGIEICAPFGINAGCLLPEHCAARLVAVRCSRVVAVVWVGLWLRWWSVGWGSSGGRVYLVEIANASNAKLMWAMSNSQSRGTEYRVQSTVSTQRSSLMGDVYCSRSTPMRISGYQKLKTKIVHSPQTPLNGSTSQYLSRVKRFSI
jgi:hypothetical protein